MSSFKADGDDAIEDHNQQRHRWPTFPTCSRRIRAERRNVKNAKDTNVIKLQEAMRGNGETSNVARGNSWRGNSTYHQSRRDYNDAGGGNRNDQRPPFHAPYRGLKPFSPIRNGRQFTRGGNRQNQARFSSADRYDQSRRQNGLHMNRSHLNMRVLGPDHRNEHSRSHIPYERTRYHDQMPPPDPYTQPQSSGVDIKNNSAPVPAAYVTRPQVGVSGHVATPVPPTKAPKPDTSSSSDSDSDSDANAREVANKTKTIEQILKANRANNKSARAPRSSSSSSSDSSSSDDHSKKITTPPTAPAQKMAGCVSAANRSAFKPTQQRAQASGGNVEKLSPPAIPITDATPTGHVIDLSKVKKENDFILPVQIVDDANFVNVMNRSIDNCLGTGYFSDSQTAFGNRASTSAGGEPTKKQMHLLWQLTMADDQIQRDMQLILAAQHQFTKLADYANRMQLWMKIQTDTIKSAREQLLAGADTITGVNLDDLALVKTTLSAKTLDDAIETLGKTVLQNRRVDATPVLPKYALKTTTRIVKRLSTAIDNRKRLTPNGNAAPHAEPKRKKAASSTKSKKLTTGS